MKINFGHASIMDKKINLFARAVRGIFNFFFGKATFGPPCRSMEKWLGYTGIEKLTRIDYGSRAATILLIIFKNGDGNRVKFSPIHSKSKYISVSARVVVLPIVNV